MPYYEESHEADEYEETEERDDSFPDADEYDKIYSDDGEIVEDVGTGRMAKFLADPYPTLVLTLIIAGFAIVLLTPPNLWSSWVGYEVRFFPANYLLIGVYLLLILTLVGTFFALGIWNTPVKSLLRYGGPTNIIVIWACFIVGAGDALSWIAFNTTFLPIDYTASPVEAGPAIMGVGIIILFCIYSLWLIQRTMQRE